MTTSDHEAARAALRNELARCIRSRDYVTGEQTGHVLMSTRYGSANLLIDGPLDDLSVLAQIPKVRELAEMCMSILEGNFEFTEGRPEYDMYVTWRTALEAT